jgi:hypothetical protein
VIFFVIFASPWLDPPPSARSLGCYPRTAFRGSEHLPEPQVDAEGLVLVATVEGDGEV